MAIKHLLLASLIFSPPSFGAEPTKNLTTYSKDYVIDRIYPDMSGPSENREVTFLGQEPRNRLLWVTGLSTQVVDFKTGKPQSPEYICHSHVRFDNDSYAEHNRETFRRMTHTEPKLGALVPGRLEVEFPKPFGIPIWSHEKFILNSMVINPAGSVHTLNLKIKSNISYVPDDEATVAMKALFKRTVSILVPESNGKKEAHCDEMDNSTALKTAARAPSSAKNQVLIKGGKNLLHHFLVPPGKHQYQMNATRSLRLPFDTTLHFASVHLHAYGEYVKVRDITDDRIIFESRAVNLANNLGLESSDYYSSSNGVPVYKSHKYEVIAGYNNLTDHDVDAMVDVHMYFADKSFDKNALQLGRSPRY